MENLVGKLTLLAEDLESHMVDFNDRGPRELAARIVRVARDRVLQQQAVHSDKD